MKHSEEKHKQQEVEQLYEADIKDVGNMMDICDDLLDCMTDISKKWKKMEEVLEDAERYGDEMEEIWDHGYDLIEYYEKRMRKDMNKFWGAVALKIKQLDLYM